MNKILCRRGRLRGVMFPTARKFNSSFFLFYFFEVRDLSWTRTALTESAPLSSFRRVGTDKVLEFESPQGSW